MGMLRIRLFGTVRLSHDGLSTGSRPIHAVQALLAYLLLHRSRTHARDVLLGLFWGEQSETRARSCLSTALWRLRQVLEPPGVARGTYLVCSAGGEIGFNSDSEHWLDVAAFESGAGQLPRAGATPSGFDWRTAECALGHYSGDLLEGFYDEWALRERERLRMLYLESTSRLLEHYSASDAIEAALACGRRILELDPLREEVHREVIRVYLRSGQRASALRQYWTCRDLLARELNVAPMEETQALCDRILSESVPRPVPALRDSFLRDLLPSLRTATNHLEQARDQLSRAICLAEGDHPPSP
jgi:DNA-binding SARP family transcriptional activator